MPSHRRCGTPAAVATASVDLPARFARSTIGLGIGYLLARGLQALFGARTVEDAGATDESGDGISAENGPFDVEGSDKQFMLDWTTSGHTDVPVPVSAIGPGARRFSGQHPNTFVHTVLAPALTSRRH